MHQRSENDFCKCVGVGGAVYVIKRSIFASASVNHTLMPRQSEVMPGKMPGYAQVWLRH